MKKIVIASVAIAAFVVAGQTVSAFAKARPAVSDPSATPVATALPWQGKAGKVGPGHKGGKGKAPHGSSDVRSHDARGPLAFSLDFRSVDCRSGDVRSGSVRFKPMPPVFTGDFRKSFDARPTGDVRFAPAPGKGGHAGPNHGHGHGRP